jgi:hypothetical protein
MEASPTSQQSQRSRPNYRHPILLEDDRSRITEAALGSPSSNNDGSIPSDYDPEAPYPHTENPYAYGHSPDGNAGSESATHRIGTQPSSPTAIQSPRQYNPTRQGQQHSPASNASNASQQSGPINMRGSSHEYYQGVIPFLGTPPLAQVSC